MINKLQQGKMALGLVFIALIAFGCNSSLPSKQVHYSGPTIEKTTETGPVKLTIRVGPDKPRLSDLVEMEVLVTAPDKIVIDHLRLVRLWAIF